ncbi:MAG: DoxX family protein [Chlamydiae bacterium]|nr:DoxX family protein [Chlamydiota bacterium]
MRYIVLLGRLLFSSIFIIKGLEHFSKTAINLGTKMGIPVASFLVPLAGLVALAGGLSILIGYKARLGAWLLVVFLIPTTLVMHKFWMLKDAHHAMMHNYCFWKNIALLGASLMIAYFGSGPCSVCKQCCPNKK